MNRFCERLGITPTATCGADTDAVLKCFLTGFFQNTALLQPDGSYKSVTGSQIVKIHPGSAMFGRRVEGIMYNELVRRRAYLVRSSGILTGTKKLFCRFLPRSIMFEASLLSNLLGLHKLHQSTLAMLEPAQIKKALLNKKWRCRKEESCI